jgi:hypothetical protein
MILLQKHMHRHVIHRLAALLILWITLVVLSGCAADQARFDRPLADDLATKAVIPSAAAGSLPTPLPEPPVVPVMPTFSAVETREAGSAHKLEEFHGAALILSPGDTSGVVSPLKAQIMVRVHPAGIIHIDLVGRGGLLYTRRLLDLRDQSGQEVFLQPDLAFETQDESEPARLVVRLLDDAGRTIALTSANLTLLSDGKSVIEPSRASGWIEIISPLEGESIEGGKVQVIASVTPVNDQPIVAELLTDEGTAINTRLVKLPEGYRKGESIHLDFDLPYAVTGPTPCLLTLYQASYHQIEGKLMLNSIPVILLP